MPLALLIIGLIVVIAGIRNNAGVLGATIASDFTGSGNFFYWIVAVIVIGSVGYNPKLKQVSHLFLLLIVIVFILSNNGFFAQLQQALNSPLPASPNQANNPLGSPADIAGAAAADDTSKYLIAPFAGFPGLLKSATGSALIDGLLGLGE